MAFWCGDANTLVLGDKTPEDGFDLEATVKRSPPAPHAHQEENAALRQELDDYPVFEAITPPNPVVLRTLTAHSAGGSATLLLKPLFYAISSCLTLW